MNHQHTETVTYEERVYSRTYKHSHLADHEAHAHPRGWSGTSRNRTEHHVMLEDNVPVVRTVTTTLPWTRAS